MKFVNGLVVNEANVLHIFSHLWKKHINLPNHLKATNINKKTIKRYIPKKTFFTILAVGPITAVCAPSHFYLIQMQFMEHQLTTIQQRMIENEIITFKHNQCRHYGGAGDLWPLTTASAPILVYSEYCFGALRNDKTTGTNGKRNKYVQ